MSNWHINNQGQSIIKRMVEIFNDRDTAYIHIFTKDDDFYIFDDDDVIVANGFIYIQSITTKEDHDELFINIINVNMIESIYIKDKNVADIERTLNDNS